jgi:general L-amino acid transport system permease protein
MAAMLEPPAPLSFGQRWGRAMFASRGSSLTTALLLMGLVWVIYKAFSWGVWNATTAVDTEVCRQSAGACWGAVRYNHRMILLGRYPVGEGWRPVLGMVLLLGSVVLAATPRFFGMKGVWTVVGALVVFIALMAGGFAGLTRVESDLWGGLPLTLLLSTVAVIASVPLGIALALGRRSELPIVRWVCTGYIELVRGVPLITVLFFGAFVLPLVLPPSWRVDAMIRVAICLVAFSAAYLAEVYRGGLQAITKGQGEAAHALSLSRWQALKLVILPQAARLTIPPATSHFIGVLKDTSLVAIVNIYDLTGSLKMALTNPDWRPYFVEAYLVVSVIYLALGLSIVRYGRFLENRYALDKR